MKHNMHVFIISRSFLLRMRDVSHKVVEKIKTHILCSITFFPENRAVYEKNTVQPDSQPMTVRRMRIACWMPQFTNTYSEYVTLIAFPLQK